jgi:hypothetical protein
MAFRRSDVNYSANVDTFKTNAHMRTAPAAPRSTQRSGHGCGEAALETRTLLERHGSGRRPDRDMRITDGLPIHHRTAPGSGRRRERVAQRSPQGSGRCGWSNGGIEGGDGGWEMGSGGRARRWCRASVPGWEVARVRVGAVRSVSGGVKRQVRRARRSSLGPSRPCSGMVARARITRSAARERGAGPVPSRSGGGSAPMAGRCSGAWP